jgi:ATP/maltotriose-dependent transcriptional regulator MalT
VRLLEIGVKMREGSEAPAARALVAVSEYAAGDESARTRVEEAANELRLADAKQRLSYVLLATVQIDLERGRPKAARGNVEEAIELSRVIRHRSYEAWARALAVRVARALGEEEWLESQLSILREQGTKCLASYARAAVESVL